MSFRPWAAFAAMCLWAAPAAAGPPYQTDDPEPTELHHWEVYAFVSADGRHSDLGGAAGFDLNYGGFKEVQLTATLPAAFAHSSGEGWQVGRGDVELGVKYRFVNDEQSGVQAAIFPRVILPTASNALDGERARFLLPLWIQKDWGATSLFGGGGYEINPARGQRDFWQAGIALTHDFSDRLSAGIEGTYQTRETADGASSIGLNLGIIQKLSNQASLLLAGGPVFSDSRAGYHSYLALAWNY